MKILHTYCLNYNLGDYYLGIGVKNLLRKYLDVSLIAETNIQGREFNTYYINEVVNKRFDLLVIGGGGIIHGSHWPNGWFWLIDRDFIKQIRIPFIVYGVGYNYWEDESIPDRGIVHLKETYKYSASFSVRNDGSGKRIQQQIGISPKIVPDPGFHVNLGRSQTRGIDKPYVIIQLANDKPLNRFGSLVKRENFIQEMRIIASSLSLSYKLIFAPHVYEDVWLSQEISKGIDNTEIWDFSYFAFDHAYESLAYYEHAEFVIAMRGHGQIVPIAFNTPVIALENHPKHRGLMEELNLLEYIVKIDDNSFLSDLKKTIHHVEKDKALIIEKYSNINTELTERSEQAFRELVTGLNG